jgi:hypothetical protein
MQCDKCKKIASFARFTKVEKGCDAFAKLKAVGGTTQCGKFFLGIVIKEQR